ncbi:hypothetical protein NDU88_010644 [Pleurodeles waltl]|uniref:VWFD domain-containing protein n=1 Tax=Pleurodeles waltl TaxID=8319 RepID=A0AAV7PZH6_PLEWA|nr:hypothetical protein NDU88_010644 [Pleurodeles waltl]
MCMNDGFKQILCEALKTYADACLRKKVKIYEWRSIAECPVQCPLNSQFVPCGSACPATCNDAALPEMCSEACVESCQCNPGFVLKEGKCIAKSTCGCVFEGRQYGPGQTFWRNDKCTEKCECSPETNKVNCKEAKCKLNEKCDVVKGIRDCYPTSYGTCSASGDPHYVTFDGVRYNFMGTCVYLLAGLCKKSNDLTVFQVFVQNDNRGSKVVSFTSLVQVMVYNFDITISKEYPNKIMLNGLLINLPYSVDNLSIYTQGYQCYVQTSFGLLVTFDWKSYVSVKIPSTYAGAVCGLCGDFNGDKSKELTMKNNSLTTDATAFGKSWKVRDVPGCSERDNTDCSDLTSVEREQREKKKDCFILVDPSGPFRGCHAVIDPQGAFKDCVYDTCFYKGRQDIICQVIASYAAACQDAGITVYPWRLVPFTINVENEKYGNGKVSVTKMVVVEVFGYRLMLLQKKRGVVRVNGLNKNLPLTLQQGQIRVYQHGIRTIVETDFGLAVSYDMIYQVVVTVPGNYRGKLEGLCGNYNGDTRDEFLLPSNTLALDATKFGTGWKVNVEGVNCSEGCGGSGNACPFCSNAKMNVFQQDNYCGFFKQAGGPLSACYATINPDLYYNNCLFDLCAGNGDQNILCHNIQSCVAA